jgi:hypothetical protein
MREYWLIILLVAVAVYLLGRHIYRLLTGKTSSCSCCSKSCSMREADNQEKCGSAAKSDDEENDHS